jgi:hypothetical protein
MLAIKCSGKVVSLLLADYVRKSKILVPPLLFDRGSAMPAGFFQESGLVCFMVKKSGASMGSGMRAKPVEIDPDRF